MVASWRGRPRSYHGRLTARDYETGWQTRFVNPNGETCWQVERLFIAQALAAERVGLVETGDDVWDIHYGPVRPGAIIRVRFERPRRPKRQKPEKSVTHVPGPKCDPGTGLLSGESFVLPCFPPRVFPAQAGSQTRR